MGRHKGNKIMFTSPETMAHWSQEFVGKKNKTPVLVKNPFSRHYRLISEHTFVCKFIFV